MKVLLQCTSSTLPPPPPDQQQMELGLITAGRTYTDWISFVFTGSSREFRCTQRRLDSLDCISSGASSYWEELQCIRVSN